MRLSQDSPVLDPGPRRTAGQASCENLEAVVRSAPNAMVVSDPNQPDNPILFVSDGFARLTGYGRDEAVGRNCRFLQGPGTDRATVLRMRRAVEAGESCEVEILNYNKSGRAFWNAMALAPVRDETGRVAYFVASQADVTAERLRGEQIAALRRELDAERHRAEELEATLARTTGLLQEADHRMKNSLQVISSLMMLKARRIGDEAAKRALHNMAERVSAISSVHRLLQSVGQESRFDIATFAAELAADSQSAIPPGQIDFVVDVEPLTVAASKAPALALVLNELVTNAVRHGFPEGRKGRIRIEAKRDKGEIRLGVIDDGTGIEGEPPTGAFGRSLTEMLVRQLRGRIAWEDAAPGTRVALAIPLSAEENRF